MKFKQTFNVSLLISILIVGVVGVLIWQLGVFTPTGGRASYTGFDKIKMNFAETGLTHTGEFTGVFINSLDKPIKILNISVEDSGQWKISCIGKSDREIVGSGEQFKVNAYNCGVGDYWGEFNLLVTFEYEIMEDKATLRRTERGKIRDFFV